MSIDKEDKKALIDYRLEKADLALDDAAFLADAGKYGLAANRLYYALYYAATALLISNHLPVHTHAGMITLINQHFVRTAVLGRDEGRLLKRMYSLRQEGDYEDFVEVTEVDVNTFFPQVEILMNKMIGLVKQE